jgi:hypothetical protein
MAITPDGGTLIVAESYANRLTAYDIGGDSGLDNRRVWAETPGDHPDGICMDAEGAVWYADVGNQHCVRVREVARYWPRSWTGEQRYRRHTRSAAIRSRPTGGHDGAPQHVDQTPVRVRLRDAAGPACARSSRQASGRPRTWETTSWGTGTSGSSAAALAGKSNTPIMSCIG